MRNIIDFIGGSVGRVAGAGIVAGIFIVIFGVTPAIWFAELVKHPPPWLANGLLQLAVVIVGLALIWVSFRFNLWQKKQGAIDELAEDISWAIQNLLNKNPSTQPGEDLNAWVDDYNEWCARVSEKLENRAFFSKADQLHFERLGFIQPVSLTGEQKLDWWLSQLRLKFDRIRDIINWSQQRRH